MGMPTPQCLKTQTSTRLVPSLCSVSRVWFMHVCGGLLCECTLSYSQPVLARNDSNHKQERVDASLNPILIFSVAHATWGVDDRPCRGRGRSRRSAGWRVGLGRGTGSILHALSVSAAARWQ